MKALGTNNFAERDMVDWCFIGYAEVEIAPFRTVPEKENRPKAEAGIKTWIGHGYLQRFS
jgi:hypothetical protein